MPDWSAAACAGKPAERFVTPSPVPPNWRQLRRWRWLADFVDQAARVCASCPIADECRSWGVEHETYGAVYGGVLVTGSGFDGGT